MPELPAGFWIQTTQLPGPAQDQFIAPVNFEHQRRAPGSDFSIRFAGKTVRAFSRRQWRRIHLPHRLPGLFVQGDQKASLARSKIQNTEVTINNRRRAVAPDVALLAEIAMPKLSPVQVVTIHSRGTEPGDHALAISDRRRSAIGVGFVRWVFSGRRDSRLPEQFAFFAVKAHDRQALFLFERLRD